MNPYVKLENKNGIGTIEFFHPQSNSLPKKILQKLSDAINEAGMDEKIMVVILKSGGDKAFCAGGDVKSFYEEKFTDTNILRKRFFYCIFSLDILFLL